MLEDISFSINIEKQSSTKFSPYFLLFGRHPKNPYEIENSELFYSDRCLIVIYPNIYLLIKIMRILNREMM